jgi:hypothetical protein
MAALYTYPSALKLQEADAVPGDLSEGGGNHQ